MNFNENMDDFTADLTEKLKEPEYRREWLRLAISDYTENGNYCEFFRCLEYVIKSQSTVSDFAKQINMNRVQLTDILHGKTKAPSLITVSKILAGLGFALDLKTA